VRYADDGGVVTLTLARPERRNVLDGETLTALAEALRRTADDAAVRAVVLTGDGPAFCAGADLRPAEGGGSSFGSGGGPGLLIEVLEALLDHPRPTLARVQGHVAGGGNGLVAACDLAVAADDVRFAFTEVRVGVAPAVIAVACLRVMPPRAAAELLLTGQRVDAARARDAGLLTAVVPRDALDATVRSWTDALRLGGPEAVAITKQLLRRVPELPRPEAFAWMAEVSAQRFASAEAAEGMAAFAERRPPSWAT
jgi:methylglutaconyl-CoA hydratase